RRQGRCLAAQPGLVAALRLPAVVLDRPFQDAETCAGRPQIRVGQTGAYGGGELRSGGDARFRRRALTRIRSRQCKDAHVETAASAVPPEHDLSKIEAA